MRHALVFLEVIVVATAATQIAAQSPPTTFVYTVPGIAKVPGKNLTHFVSDAVITNPGSAPAFVAYGIVPPVGSAPLPAFLAPGQSITVRDVVATLFGAGTGSGALTVTGTQPLVIRAKTYNDASTGTYGVALPVYTDDRFLVSGETGHSLWISQSADPNSGFRSNVTVVFPDSGGGSATVTVLDGNGNQIGQRVFSMASAGVQQFGVGTFSSPANVARATIQVTSGRAAGYASVVDNVTGDSSLYTFDDLPAGPLDVLANGVAFASGKQGTFFRTDGRFFNPGTSDIVVTAYFHAKGTSNPSPLSQTLIVPAGKVVEITDLVGTLLGQPVGSSGAIRFTAASPVGIFCRTSNVDPTGVHPGTYGAQQRPVPILSFLSSADAGVLVTGIRQNTAFRTNIGLAAGPDGVTAQFTLKAADGTVAGSATQTLGPWGWVQPGVDVLFGGAPPADAEVVVKITQGSGDLFDSSLDNLSGDSVVTPAPALPVSIPTSATIGPAGGSVQSDDGRLTLKIPAGTLTTPTAFSVVTGTNGAPGGVGSGYTIAPSGTAFAKPARLVLRYGRDETDGSIPADLSIPWQGGGSWYLPNGQSVDTFARTIAADLPSLQLVASRSPSGRTPLVDVGIQTALSSRAGINGKAVTVAGGTRDLRAWVVLYDSSGTIVRLDGVDPGNFGYHWSVVTPNHGSVEGTPNVYAPTATYTAPACAPADRVEVRVDINDMSGGPIAARSKFIRVLPKDWTMKFTEGVTGACMHSLKFNYDSELVVDFSLDVDGKATNVNVHPGTSTNSILTCPPPQDCSVTSQGDPPPISVEFFNVYYGTQNDELILYANYTHMGTPGYMFVCPDGSAADYAHPGTPDNIAGAQFSPTAGGSAGAATDISYWTQEVKPVTGACP